MSINKLNVTADKLAYGKWSSLNQEYFANVTIINEFFRFFINAKPTLPRSINIIEFGSAEGLVGEYFAQQLSHKNETALTIVDVVHEHLLGNTNQKTRKVCKDILQFNEHQQYDLALARSLIHYFSFDEQLRVLHIIRQSLREGGYLLIAAFVQHPASTELFLKLNQLVGKHVQLLSAPAIEKLFAQAGFSETTFLGDATTWNCSSDNLKARYNLSDSTIHKMRELILQTKNHEQNGFSTTPEKFTIPIPYKIYLLKR